jgi:hypothetical protein
MSTCRHVIPAWKSPLSLANVGGHDNICSPC